MDGHALIERLVEEEDVAIKNHFWLMKNLPLKAMEKNINIEVVYIASYKIATSSPVSKSLLHAK